MPYPTKITATQSWQDVPTCKEAGVPTTYTMLRGVFMPAGVTKDQTEFYVNLLKKVRATPEWKDYMEKGAFNQTAMEGEAFGKWLGAAEQQHRELMKAAGFLAQ
jgi:putative tricarboxylic transport membrane protein